MKTNLIVVLGTGPLRGQARHLLREPNVRYWDSTQEAPKEFPARTRQVIPTLSADPKMWPLVRERARAAGVAYSTHPMPLHSIRELARAIREEPQRRREARFDADLGNRIRLRRVAEYSLKSAGAAKPAARSSTVLARALEDSAEAAVDLLQVSRKAEAENAGLREGMRNLTARAEQLEVEKVALLAQCAELELALLRERKRGAREARTALCAANRWKQRVTDLSARLRESEKARKRAEEGFRRALDLRKEVKFLEGAVKYLLRE